VASNQHGVHEKLAAQVQKHLASDYARPPADHSQRAFEQLLAALERPRPLVLDSFCGTGHSTAALAMAYPGHLVVGVDQSADRLSRHAGTGEGEYLLLQADCEDIWGLLLRHDLGVDHHYLLYPNPWPKHKHLGRRVHGSGAFQWLLGLGGTVELRSNWQLYVEEFGIAMLLAGHPGAISELNADQPLSLFEQKYRNSGHTLWRYTGRIGDRPPP
jgi:tRNA G46 methylase TrmB